MKKIICLCVGLLMLTGCSAKVITTSSGKLDMNQIPAVFSEKRNYKTTWITDQQVGFALLTTAIIGVPIITHSDDDSLVGVTAQEVLARIIPMGVASNMSVRSAIYADDRGLTENVVIVYVRYINKDIAGLEINISQDLKKQMGPGGELHPGVVPVYFTHLEVKCEKNGCVVIKENINEDEALNKRNAYVTATLQKRFKSLRPGGQQQEGY